MDVTVVASSLVGLMLPHQRNKLLGSPSFGLEVIWWEYISISVKSRDHTTKYQPAQNTFNTSKSSAQTPLQSIRRTVVACRGSGIPGTTQLMKIQPWRVTVHHEVDRTASPQNMSARDNSFTTIQPRRGPRVVESSCLGVQFHVSGVNARTIDPRVVQVTLSRFDEKDLEVVVEIGQTCGDRYSQLDAWCVTRVLHLHPKQRDSVLGGRSVSSIPLRHMLIEPFDNNATSPYV